jgi:hypothetical protein
MFFFFLLTSVGGEVMLERLGKTPVVPPLGPGHEEPRFVFAQIPKLEDRGLEHFCQRHERVSILKDQEQPASFTRCPSQALLDILSMSHPGVTIDGVIPGHKWILSMCHPGGTRGRLSLSSRHKTIKHNGMNTHIGIFVASHLVLASKTMSIAL